MNNILQNGYAGLGVQERTELRSRLSDSPRALLLLDFLESRRDKKFNTVDVVRTVYTDQQDEEFTTLRNRFFKLRKHIISMMEKTPVSTVGGVELLPLEEELFRCRQMVSANSFQQVRKQLKQLISECWRLNVFEILPEAYNLLVYTNMVLSNLREHERLLGEQIESSRLLDDLRTMQVYGRKVFYAAVSRDVKSIAVYLQAMRRVVVRRSDYPRFELYYHFIVVANAATVPGYSGKSHARHLAVLKKLNATHPGMPAGSYEPNGAALMQYYILTADGASKFMRGEVQECYKLFNEAWQIQERIPNLRIRKSEGFFKNKMTIEIATGRISEAIVTVHQLIDFHKEHKQEEKRLSGFADLAMVYSYSYPHKKCPNPDFITQQLKTFVALLRRSKSPQYGDGLSTQAIFAFICGDFKTAKNIAQKEESRNVFSSMKLDVYNELLILSPASPVELISELKRRIRSQLDKAVSSDMVFSLRRALNLIGALQHYK